MDLKKLRMSIYLHGDNQSHIQSLLNVRVFPWEKNDPKEEDCNNTHSVLQRQKSAAFILPAQ
jgi:hypothetical protein